MKLNKPLFSWCYMSLNSIWVYGKAQKNDVFTQGGSTNWEKITDMWTTKCPWLGKIRQQWAFHAKCYQKNFVGGFDFAIHFICYYHHHFWAIMNIMMYIQGYHTASQFIKISCPVMNLKQLIPGQLQNEPMRIVLVWHHVTSSWLLDCYQVWLVTSLDSGFGTS